MWSVVSDSFATPWTVALQAPLFIGFPRQEYWNGLPFPIAGGLPDLGVKHAFPVSPASQVESLPRKPQRDRMGAYFTSTVRQQWEEVVF